MVFYERFARPVFFRFHPDYVHDFAVNTGHLLGKTSLSRKMLSTLYNFEDERLNTKAFGIKFKNPVGIAGGFDKNAKLIQTLPNVGFGFVEVGSITARPYKGNRRPWNVRLPKDKSLIVNYGLKNEGVEVLRKRIKKQKRTTPLIINIAKTNDVKIKGDASVEDYNKSFIKLQSLADIININVSCPNTGDGTLFCESPKLLNKLLNRVAENKISKPVVLKLKPDISDEILEEILRIVKKFPFVKGFIISNLSGNRRLLKRTKPKEISHYSGGISGKPMYKLSNEMIKKVYKKTNGKYTIIGLGGIFAAEDAYEKICLGASLVEIATGLIYGGPGTVKKINKGLIKLLEKDGFKNISEAVGSRNRNL